MKPFVLVIKDGEQVGAKDLQEMLDVAYKQGYEDGTREAVRLPWYYQTVPYYTTSPTCIPNEPRRIDRTEVTC